jgi:hypothetical protein
MQNIKVTIIFQAVVLWGKRKFAGFLLNELNKLNIEKFLQLI